MINLIKDKTRNNEYNFKVDFNGNVFFVKNLLKDNSKLRVTTHGEKQITAEEARKILESVINEKYRYVNEHKINDHCPTEFIFTK